MRVCVPGISSFAELIRGRNVVIWSDNTGAEAVAKRGTAKTFDHCCLAHALWKRFAELQLGVWVERVPTEVNIADLGTKHLKKAHPNIFDETLKHVCADAESAAFLSDPGRLGWPQSVVISAARGYGA